MPRRRNLSPPAYCLHRASGRAVVRIDGKDHYLGPHGSPESHAQYERLLAEWRVRKAERCEKQQAAQSAVDASLTITQVIQHYRQFAGNYYVRDDGKPTKELAEMRLALRPLRQLYGSSPARDFGPLNLKAVRQHMIDVLDLSRGVINHRINRIRRFFKWAVSEELIPPTVSQALQVVEPLRRRRSTAREAPPVRPVADKWVELVLPELSPQVAALVQLQRLTGMRPGEIVLMRASDIDMTGDVWIYEPHDHKNEWREQRRLVPLGPKAQAIVREFLGRSTEQYLFSPRDAKAWRNERRAEQRNPHRKTKIYPCELRARERRRDAARKRKSKRPKRDRYDVDSYRRAITYAIDRLNRQRLSEGQEPVPAWYPLQLRHSRATEVRRLFGIEGAQVSLGHAHAAVTEVYAERNLDLAIRIAEQTG